jgi:predicted DNA-binding transcriptional regulator AlpA
MAKKDQLTTAEVAKLVGVKPSTWRSYLGRNTAPPPDGRYDERTVYWYRSTIERWVKARPGRGARSDLGRKRKR